MEFSNDMLDKVIRASEEVKGTVNYSRYYMETYVGKTFVGYNLPRIVGKIRMSRGKSPRLCIYAGDLRYVINQNVADLLGLEG